MTCLGLVRDIASLASKERAYYSEFFLQQVAKTQLKRTLVIKKILHKSGQQLVRPLVGLALVIAGSSASKDQQGSALLSPLLRSALSSTSVVLGFSCA